MATTAEISKTEISKFTWRNQSYKWSDAVVRSRTWNDMRIYAYYAKLGETLATAELLAKSATTKQVDSFGVADKAPLFLVKKGIAEAVSIAESIKKDGTTTFREPIAFVDETSADMTIGFDEVVALRDYIKNAYEINQTRTLKFVETREGLNIYQAHASALGVSELLSNEMQRQFSSSLGFIEARFQKGLGKELATVLAIAEAKSTNFTFKLKEMIAIAEVSSKRPILGFSSKFGIDSYHGKSYSVNNKETLTVADAIDRQINFLRTIEEALSVEDLPSKNVQTKLLEELKVLDAFLRKADVAVADMVLSTLAAGEDIDLAAFENLVTNGAMPGYTNWRDFIPGDYEYTKALFRVIIESSTADRAQIQQLDVAVDVPDVNDRGTVTVTNATAGAVVEYNRLYHVIPDVTLSAKGGLTHPTVPEFLVAPNLVGFTVRLRDTITGDYVKGTFTWSAHGY